MLTLNISKNRRNCLKLLKYVKSKFIGLLYKNSLINYLIPNIK